MNKLSQNAGSPDAAKTQTMAERQVGGLLRWTSKTLFSGAREIIIEHAGVEYRLRLTSQDKLILTK
ncbi:MAG: hemin uptake protein HemP [Betaproteobacteria bacterium HGW-Betaproteobacteria-1]|jgi:hemin uptake protein HemP|nr:MAG: hemin uptake protein HemP [Betaproteobacteria bacterium HGW-Betaproteobacteria-1]